MALCQGIAPKSDDEDDLWFPKRGRRDLEAKAKQICMDCPVSKECEEYSNNSDTKFGIWAGKTLSKGKSNG